MTQWYYRCEVKGIQSFVMRGSKLREVVGASALIESMFDRGSDGGSSGEESLLQRALRAVLGAQRERVTVLYCAAGGATLTFDDASGDLLRAWVAEWPLWVDENVPGVHLVQAWVHADDVASDYDGDPIYALVSRLNEARNRMPVSLPAATPIMDQSIRGGAACQVGEVGRKDKQFVDRAMLRQLEVAKGDHPLQRQLKHRFLGDFNSDSRKLPFDIEDMLGGRDDSSSYIAVIHIDGNRVGQELIGLGVDELSEFSAELSRATLSAVSFACDEALRPRADAQGNIGEYMLGRPVVVGGDDVTAIVRADRALEFTRSFIREFERATGRLREVKPDLEQLTASAGIAFVRRNHPFRDAHDLAEQLCKHAKRAWVSALGDEIATHKSPSLISFQRVTSSLAIIDQPSRDELKRRVGPFYVLGSALEDSAEDRRFLSVDHLEDLALAVQRRGVSTGRLRGLIDMISEARAEVGPNAKHFSKAPYDREWQRIEQIHEQRAKRAQDDPWGAKSSPRDGTVMHALNQLEGFRDSAATARWVDSPWASAWRDQESLLSDQWASPWVDVYDLISSGAVPPNQDTASEQVSESAEEEQR